MTLEVNTLTQVWRTDAKEADDELAQRLRDRWEILHIGVTTAFDSDAAPGQTIRVVTLRRATFGKG